MSLNKEKRKTLYLVKLITKLASKIGAKVIVEPKWGYTAQIIYKNGVVRSICHYSLDLNHIASSDIARDKGFAKFFMKKNGYPVAPGTTVYSDSWAKTVKSNHKILYGIKYAKKLGYPIIVKPNSKSQGTEVSAVWNEKELRRALLEIFKIDKIAIVEKYLPGQDYRIVVLDGKIISAYERIPLSVVGDGKRSILSLLKQKQKTFILSGRDTRINFNDKRIKIKLKRQGYSLNSIISKNHRIYLLDNANLSTGGDVIDITNKISSGFSKIAVNLSRDMGLRIAGVDIMTTKGNIAKNPKNCSYYIIEINSAPGLDHYVTTGPAQQKIVEAMYLKVFKALSKKG
jgi:D-alanine-D-alanine ligase-like ATP-grasp enzyme